MCRYAFLQEMLIFLSSNLYPFWTLAKIILCNSDETGFLSDCLSLMLGIDIRCIHLGFSSNVGAWCMWASLLFSLICFKFYFLSTSRIIYSFTEAWLLPGIDFQVSDVAHRPLVVVLVFFNYIDELVVNFECDDIPFLFELIKALGFWKKFLGFVCVNWIYACTLNHLHVEQNASERLPGYILVCPTCKNFT